MKITTSYNCMIKQQYKYKRISKAKNILYQMKNRLNRFNNKIAYSPTSKRRVKQFK